MADYVKIQYGASSLNLDWNDYWFDAPVPVGKMTNKEFNIQRYSIECVYKENVGGNESVMMQLADGSKFSFVTMAMGVKAGYFVLEELKDGALPIDVTTIDLMYDALSVLKN